MPDRKSLPDRTRRLSQRQCRVVEMVAQGLKNREIANALGIGVHVVRNYLSTVYDKIGVSNRVELALWYEARQHEINPRRCLDSPPSDGYIGGMTHQAQPIPMRHEVEIHGRRTERNAEDRKLILLKARLQAAIQKQEHPTLLVRAS